MIYIGNCEKEKIIAEKIRDCGAEKVVILGDILSVPDGVEIDCVSFADSIKYVHFYRLLGKIDAKTLVVWNGFFRTANRYALNYNCARRYFQQTPHRLIFEPFPFRERKEEFMLFWDMTRPNPFLKERFSDVKKFTGTHIYDSCSPTVEIVNITLPDASLSKYEKLKAEAIAAVKKDPDIIPRRLLKFSESENEKIAGSKFDSKAELKPSKMKISVNQTGVDKWFKKDIERKLEEVELIKAKI